MSRGSGAVAVLKEGLEFQDVPAESVEDQRSWKLQVEKQPLAFAGSANPPLSHSWPTNAAPRALSLAGNGPFASVVQADTSTPAVRLLPSGLRCTCPPLTSARTPPPTLTSRVICPAG